jgi:hypothetical protein
LGIDATGLTAIGSQVIVNADINNSAAIAFSKMETIGSAEIIVGNGSGVPTAVAVTGDIGIDNTGLTAITAGAIINADINVSAGIALSKLATATSADIIVHDGSGVPTAVAMTGDIGIDNTGLTAITADSIVNADINSAAAIASTKLSPWSADRNANNNKLTNLTDPTAAQDAATKAYVDATTQNLKVHTPHDVASTQPVFNDGTTPSYSPTGGTSARGQITWATGPTAIDGVTLANDDRIMLKDEGNGLAEVTDITCLGDTAGSLQSTYIEFDTNASTGYYAWINVSGGGVDPLVAGRTGIEVTIATNDIDSVVAAAFETAINAAGIEATAAAVGAVVTLTNEFGGDVTPTADGTAATGFAIVATTGGTGLCADANGWWTRTSQNTWDRSTDADTDAEYGPGSFSFVTEGTTNGDNGFIVTTDDPFQVGGDNGTSITIVQFSGAGQIEAGDALTKSGNTLNVVSGNTAIVANADTLDLTLATDPGLEIASGLKIDPLDSSIALAAGGVSAAVLAYAAPTAMSVTSGNGSDTGLDVPFNNDHGGGMALIVNSAIYPIVMDGTSGVAGGACAVIGDGGGGFRTAANVQTGDPVIWNGGVAGFEWAVTDSGFVVQTGTA